MNNRIPWDKYFMALAKLAAIRSGCNSRPTGAVIVLGKRVIATGYNGSLPGQPQCTDNGPKYCHRRSLKVDDKGDKKYQECPAIHAEQNALNQITSLGGLGDLSGAKVYCTLQPCIMCLKNISSVGIQSVFYEMKYHSDDKERDDYWFRKAKEYKVKYKQIELTNDDLQKIYKVLIGNTSQRRL